MRQTTSAVYVSVRLQLTIRVYVQVMMMLNQNIT